jgi:hypothetical protein
MNQDTLRLARNILLRSFVVGLVLCLILGVATLAYWDTWAGMASSWFHADEALLASVVLGFFMNVRFFLLFILLTPGLALHWTLKCERKKKGK